MAVRVLFLSAGGGAAAGWTGCGCATAGGAGGMGGSACNFFAFGGGWSP